MISPRIVVVACVLRFAFRAVFAGITFSVISIIYGEIVSVCLSGCQPILLPSVHIFQHQNYRYKKNFIRVKCIYIMSHLYFTQNNVLFH